VGDFFRGGGVAGCLSERLILLVFPTWGSTVVKIGKERMPLAHKKL